MTDPTFCSSYSSRMANWLSFISKASCWVLTFLFSSSIYAWLTWTYSSARTVDFYKSNSRFCDWCNSTFFSSFELNWLTGTGVYFYGLSRSGPSSNSILLNSPDIGDCKVLESLSYGGENKTFPFLISFDRLIIDLDMLELTELTFALTDL